MSESPAPTLGLDHARSYAAPCLFASGGTIYNAHVVVSRDGLDGHRWTVCLALSDEPHRWIVGVRWEPVVYAVAGSTVSVFESPQTALAAAWATPEISPRI